MNYIKDVPSIQKLYENVANSGRLVLDKDRDIWGSTLVPEVRKALLRWTKECNIDGIIIGGLVIGLYAKPRTTMDVDIVFLGGESTIPSYVEGFKKTRPHAFEHKETGVEIETLTPEYLNLRQEVVEYVKNNWEVSGGVKVASKLSLIILKAQGMRPRDKADIYDLFETMDEYPKEIDNFITFEQSLILFEIWKESRFYQIKK